MKKIFLLCFATMMFGCKTFFYGVEPTFTMGMSEKEFKEKNKPELVLATEQGNRIYSTYNPLSKYKFFFFKDEKLVRFETGSYADEYKFNWLM